MAEQTIYVRATRASVRRAVAQVPTAARSGGPVADAMMVRCGMAALGRIRAAFVVKSHGGTDEAGDRWAPLKPKTIAYGRRHRKKPGDPKQSRVFSRAKSPPWVPRPSIRAGYAPSYALTRRQNDRWWELYRQGLAIFRGDKGAAARRAWAIGKREGMTTIIAQYGNAKVDTLRDTGLLLSSLSPGVASQHQIFRVGPGQVIVGTNRRGASAHHSGVPGRLPQRRLWPHPGRWPVSWWTDIAETARDGLVDLAIQLITGGKAT